MRINEYIFPYINLSIKWDAMWNKRCGLIVAHIYTYIHVTFNVTDKLINAVARDGRDISMRRYFNIHYCPGGIYLFANVKTSSDLRKTCDFAYRILFQKLCITTRSDTAPLIKRSHSRGCCISKQGVHHKFYAR